jgi:hypothetical protein
MDNKSGYGKHSSKEVGGEHDEEILKELGFDAKEIDRFRTSGTLGKPKEPAKGT